MKKYGIIARNRGMWGGITVWCTGRDGQPLLFDTYEEAAAEAESFRNICRRVNSFTQYFPKEYKED